MAWEEQHPELARELRAFKYDLKKVTDGLAAGMGALEEGDLAGARDMIGLTHYALGRIAEHRRAAVDLLTAEIDAPTDKPT